MEEYKDHNSNKFKEFSHTLTSAIENLYSNYPGRRMARVISVQ